jgi:uncharacterized RDD family membrane protein YckC
MANNFITDNEIDRILGRITEYRKEPERRSAVDRPRITVEEKAKIREEYARKKAQEFASSYASPNTSDTSYNNISDYGRSVNDKTTHHSVTSNVSAFTSAGVSAGIVRRVYAFLTDLCIVGLAMVGFVSIAMYFFGTETFNKTSVYGVTSVSWLLFGLYAILFGLYLVYFEGLIGQTPGKMFLNIKVLDSNNQKPDLSTMILRMVIFFIPPLGLFGIHNLITKTKLVMNG